MTLGQTIYDMVSKMMFTARIDSPRFDDYSIYAVEQSPGSVRAIDQELAKTGGGVVAPTKLRTQAEVDRRFRQFMERVEKEQSGQSTKKTFQLDLKTILQKDLGVGKGYQAFNMLANPKSTMLNILRGAGPILAGIVMAIHIAPIVAKLLTKRGSIFDLTFREKADELNNVLRSRSSQQEIRVGMGTQIIFTTAAGTINPRDAYNTYTEKNHNEAEFERQWSVRDNYGVD